MASPRTLVPLRHMFQNKNCVFCNASSLKRRKPQSYCSLATETIISSDPSLSSPTSISLQDPSWLNNGIPAHIQSPSILTTLYNFPSMEPLRFVHYPSLLLDAPLRRDIIHRAVIYEGDKTRKGLASAKWRSEVHGSGRKLRPQKGTGRARLGDKKSPMLRGGGVAFPPKPRDFSTGLPRKIYDLAWLTALSYRWRKGQLVIVDNAAELESPRTEYLEKVFSTNKWGHKDGRSLVVTDHPRANLAQALREAGQHGRTLVKEDVDVKDLLELGRLIIERPALRSILTERSRVRYPKAILAIPE